MAYLVKLLMHCIISGCKHVGVPARPEDTASVGRVSASNHTHDINEAVSAALIESSGFGYPWSGTLSFMEA